MKLGTAYYPEHEREEAWADDYAKLAEAGIEQIRIAEFAWSMLEPEDGNFQWGWLDRAIDFAGQYGLGVVLCTPTACPPAWLAELHPDILPMNKHGQTVGVGARQHRSYFSANYEAYSLRITARMGERYGAHPGIVAWQLDNEFGGETKYDFSPAARQAFHRHLAGKYGSIDVLNESWGTVFWSQTYASFEQIPLPAPLQADVHMWHHPSLELEYARFSSEGIVQYAGKQAATLRSYVGSTPITTNAFMFRWGDNIDWSRLFAPLDVVGMDIYSDQPHEIAFYADACRSVLGKPFWMMEYGTGAKELSRDMELASSRGCSRFFLFKAKPFRWGQEQGGGQPELLTMTGEPSRNYAVVQRFAASRAGKEAESAAAASDVGIFYDFDSSWAYQLSVADKAAYPDYVVDVVYRALHDGGMGAEIIYSADQIGQQPVVALPLHILYDEALEDRLITYVQGGGKLILTADVFRKNDDNAYLRQVPRLFGELLGWTVNNFIPDIYPDQTGLLLHSQSGDGQVWVLSRNSTLEDWKLAWEKACGFAASGVQV